jgi:chromosome segregation ATPase
MKIIKLTVENFMRLVAVEITPQGNAIMITGRNGEGKSSVFEAIRALFGGKKYHPERPIREGADQSKIIGETESFIIKRTFTSKGGSITVTNADNMKASSPQALLEKLYGEIAFEPMGFYKDSKEVKRRREQREALMKLVGLDFSDIDADIASVKAARSAVKISRDTYEHEAKQIPDYHDVPEELISMDELTAKLALATQHNEKQADILRQLETKKNEVASFEKGLEDNKSLIEDLKKKLANAETSLQVTEKAIVTAQEEQEVMVANLESAIDIETINQEITDAESINDKIRGRKQKIELLGKMRAKSGEYAELRNKTKDLESVKAKRLANAKMPIEKLSVNEETILYEGIPLSQVNDAMQLQIAVAISMALNPKLKVILMKGNDLDKANLEAVCKMAEEKDYQVWIEKVSDDKKNTSGFIIEDGSVVAPEDDTLFTDKGKE